MALLEKLVFKYGDQDFVYNTSWSSYDGTHKSQFEKLIEMKWNEAMAAGLFRYSLGDVKTRIVPGTKKYVLQLNEQRMIERRNPDFFPNCGVPFDSNKFNFTRVKPGEILFYVAKIGNESSILVGNHAIVINVSPLEKCHILLVPNIDKCIPQKLTYTAVQMVIEMLLLSSNPAWRAGFNSLCALASVNHQHVHAWKLDHRIYLEHVGVNKHETGLHCLEDKSVKALAFQLHGSSIENLARNVFEVTNYFQMNDIPHNVFITRGESFNDLSISTIRIFIFPRKPFNGNKVESLKMHPFNVACAELSGHIPVYVGDAFDLLTEEHIENVIEKEMISNDEFDHLLRTLSFNIGM